jgi:hypothetical protein
MRVLYCNRVNHVTDRQSLQRSLVPEQGIQGSRNVVPAYPLITRRFMSQGKEA